MRKLSYLLVTFLSVCLFSSCSNDEFNTTPQEEAKNQPVEVTVNVPTSLKSTLSDQYDLRYYIHKNTGEFVRYSYIPQGTASIQENLPNGEYTVSVLATTSSAPWYITNPSPIQQPYNNFSVEVNGGSDNLLFASTNIHVENSPVSSSVDLEQIVGKIQINVEDAYLLPAEYTNVSLTLSGKTPLIFKFQNQKTNFIPLSYLPALTLNGNDFRATPAPQFTLYLLSNTGEYSSEDVGVDLHIGLSGNTSPNNNRKLIKSNLEIERNQTVSLTGKLFTNEGEFITE
ncbi:MAG: FimB/Mfa2 family fimbrial subunit [Dysgonomonas sp.]|nr:FimB/Mfa2 family fimbrial subunit [Dysgonomonas sp.]